MPVGNRRHSITVGKETALCSRVTWFIGLFGLKLNELRHPLAQENPMFCNLR